MAILWDENWELFALKLAREASFMSKDPSSKVGACILRQDKTVASIGFNGFPRGIKDDERLHDRERKLRMILHAEENAILHAKDPYLDGFMIATWPYPPCAHCASIIIQSGIRHVVCLKDKPERWKDDFRITWEVFAEAGVSIKEFDYDDVVI